MVRTLGVQWHDLVVPAILIFDQNGRLLDEYIGGNQTEAIIRPVRQHLNKRL